MNARYSAERVAARLVADLNAGVTFRTAFDRALGKGTYAKHGDAIFTAFCGNKSKAAMANDVAAVVQSILAERA